MRMENANSEVRIEKLITLNSAFVRILHSPFTAEGRKSRERHSAGFQPCRVPDGSASSYHRPVDKLLIVTADDVGLHPAMTAGAIRCHGEGIVTACSVVANGLAFDDAVEQLRSAPALSVGVHLALVEERPVSRSSDIPSLVDDAGRLHRSFRSFVPRYLAGWIRMVDLERELRAQIEKLLGAGLRLDHANGHQHLHQLPGIFDLLVRLCGEYGIGYVRIVDDGPHLRPLHAVRDGSIAVLSALGRRARRRAGELRTNDRTIGVAEAGHLSRARLARLLDRVAGVTELVCHPATSPAAGHDWGYDWQGELDALCGPEAAGAIAQRNIRVTSPGRLLARG
jgi:predicted glycoside hydrolase/deacetylase ChbG (UPF0249 family)